MDYATTSLPTAAQVITNTKLNNASNNTSSNSNVSSSNAQLPPLNRHPTSIPTCQHCHQTNITTRTTTYPSIETFLMCGGLVLIFWPVCWIPLVMDSAKRTDHLCTNCNSVVGTVKPLSDCCVKERG